MEQRSQILKQMHLTKNEREREVRVPCSQSSQSYKLLWMVGLHKCGWFWADTPDHQHCPIYLSHPLAPITS